MSHLGHVPSMASQLHGQSPSRGHRTGRTQLEHESGSMQQVERHRAAVRAARRAGLQRATKVGRAGTRGAGNRGTRAATASGTLRQSLSDSAMPHASLPTRPGTSFSGARPSRSASRSNSAGVRLGKSFGRDPTSSTGTTRRVLPARSRVRTVRTGRKNMLSASFSGPISSLAPKSKSTHLIKSKSTDGLPQLSRR